MICWYTARSSNHFLAFHQSKLLGITSLNPRLEGPGPWIKSWRQNQAGLQCGVMVWLGWAGLVRTPCTNWNPNFAWDPFSCLVPQFLSPRLPCTKMRACPPEGWIMRKSTFRRAQGIKHYSCLQCKAVRDPGHHREVQEAAEISFKVIFDSILF